MTNSIRYLTTAAIKQSLCDQREAVRRQRWSANLGRWAHPESIPPRFDHTGGYFLPKKSRTEHTEGAS